jgi:hypothetical protein
MVGSFLILLLLSLAGWEFWRYATALYSKGAGFLKPVQCACKKWELLPDAWMVYDDYGRHELELCQPSREVIA